MEVNELQDMANVIRSHMLSKIDKRFKLRRFVRNFQHDDVQSAVEFGDTISLIVIDKEQCESLTPPQVVDYITREIRLANEELIGCVDGDEWDGQ